jgi:hypothetical protein
MKYVQNVHIALIKCRIEDPDSPRIAGRVASRDFLFRPASNDRNSGRQLESGFTAVEDSDYEALVKQSKLFTHAVEQKLLFVHDDLPAEAQTPHDMLVATRRELAAANARIAELEAALAEKGDKGKQKAGDGSKL